MKKITDNIFEISGAIHLHTTYSDGSSTYPKLISTAKSLGLDYAIVTDHMTLEAKDDGYERFWGQLLVLVGYEHNDRKNRNHYIAIGSSKVADLVDSAQEYIDEINEMGGFGFLAHPAEKRKFFRKYPSYPWTDWDCKGYAGIELWNQMSEWVEKLRTPLDYIRIFFPRRFMRHAPSSLVSRWDELNKKRAVSAIGGVDSHAHIIKKFGLKFRIFPLKVELKGIRTHLYVDMFDSQNFKETKKTLLKALKSGSGYISNYRRGDASGSSFLLKDLKGNVVLPGKSICEDNLPSRLYVEIPKSGIIRLIKDGRVLKRTRGEKCSFKIDSKGLYRVEVARNGAVWIYSNHFCVGERDND